MVKANDIKCQVKNKGLLGKIDFSNPATLSGSGGIFAGARFLPDLDKVPDSGRSRRRNPVQPYFHPQPFILPVDK